MRGCEGGLGHGSLLRGGSNYFYSFLTFPPPSSDLEHAQTGHIQSRAAEKSPDGKAEVIICEGSMSGSGSYQRSRSQVSNPRSINANSRPTSKAMVNNSNSRPSSKPLNNSISRQAVTNSNSRPSSRAQCDL